MIVFFFLPQKEKETNDAFFFVFVVDIFFEDW